MTAARVIDYGARRRERIAKLKHAYVNEAQLGLILGAGATTGSGIPQYNRLALLLLERASHHPSFSGPREAVRSFVKQERERLDDGKEVTASPEEVVLFARVHLGANEALLRRLVREQLYAKASSVGKTVGRSAFTENRTLDAVLSFCAAKPGGPLASRSKYKIEANSRVGGILTTNYDNLLEGAFHTKFRRNLLKPVTHPAARESQAERRVIPVYHIHGYLGYRPPRRRRWTAKSAGIVIAQDDYFQSFYDPLGFRSYIAMSFLRRFPCLFIGSAMTDQNLRRFLFHLREESEESAYQPARFAILPKRSPERDAFDDAILLSYGVQAIWVEPFEKKDEKNKKEEKNEIPEILRRLYQSFPGVADGDWKYVWDFRW
jgi:hypothetical protein